MEVVVAVEMVVVWVVVLEVVVMAVGGQEGLGRREELGGGVGRGRDLGKKASSLAVAGVERGLELVAVVVVVGVVVRRC